MTIGALNQGMVAGDLVNTASRLQSVARARHRPRRRGDTPRGGGRDRVRGGRRPGAQGQGRPRRGVPGAPGRRDRRRRRPDGGARAAVRRPRDGVPAPARALPRDRPRAPGTARVADRPGGDRQEPARVGVPEVPRRRSASRCGGTTAARRRTARASRSGRSARWSASGPAWSRATTRRPPEPAVRERRRARRRRERARVRRARAARAARASTSRRPAAGTGCSPGWRLFIERLSETSTVVLVFEDVHWADDGLLDFIEHLLEWSRSYPDPRRHARPTRAARPPPDVGRAPHAPRRAGPRARSASPEMRELLAGLVPGLPEPAVRRDPRARRRDPALRRRDRPDARRRRPPRARRRRPLPPDRQARRARGPGDAPGAHRGPPRRARRPRSGAPAGRVRARQDVHPRRPRGRQPDDAPRSSSLGCARSWRASCWSSTRIRPRRSAASTASSRRSSARSPTRRSPSATGAAGTSPPRGSSRRAGRTSWPRSWRATTSTPTGPRPTDPRARRCARRHGSRCGRRPSAPTPSGSYGSARHVPGAGARARGRRTPSDEAELLERAGNAADLDGQYERASTLLTQALAALAGGRGPGRHRAHGRRPGVDPVGRRAPRSGVRAARGRPL